MAREISWSVKASAERNAILGYWIEHNKSEVYSHKLLRLSDESLARIAESPKLGMLTNEKGIRRIVVAKHFLVFYEFTETELKILTFFDGRQDPKKKQHFFE